MGRLRAGRGPDAARDRAAQAQAYRDLTIARTAEHAEYTTAMQSRLDRQESALSELEVALTSAQQGTPFGQGEVRMLMPALHR